MQSGLPPVNCSPISNLLAVLVLVFGVWSISLSITGFTGVFTLSCIRPWLLMGSALPRRNLFAAMGFTGLSMIFLTGGLTGGSGVLIMYCIGGLICGG